MIDVTGSRAAAGVINPAVVSAADMVSGHVGLDISCLDGLYVTGFVAKLQTPGGVVYFLHDHRGQPIASPALFEPIGAKFRRDMKDWAQANGVPVVTFKAGDRKVEVMRPYLEQAAGPQFSFTKQQRRVLVFYVYIWDQRMGPGFIKICTYFPYPIKVWVNGQYAETAAMPRCPPKWLRRRGLSERDAA